MRSRQIAEKYTALHSETLINIFSDTETVLHDYRLSEKMSKEEFSARNAANRKMQEIYLDNIEAFDETVIYTGDGKEFFEQNGIEFIKKLNYSDTEGEYNTPGGKRDWFPKSIFTSIQILFSVMKSTGT